MTYDPAADQFTLEHDSLANVGSVIPYSLKAKVDFPTTCSQPEYVYDTDTADITINDPCATPTSLTVGVNTDTDTDYSVSAEWEFPTYSVVPSVCASTATF